MVENEGRGNEEQKLVAEDDKEKEGPTRADRSTSARTKLSPRSWTS